MATRDSRKSGGRMPRRLVRWLAVAFGACAVVSIALIVMAVVELGASWRDDPYLTAVDMTQLQGTSSLDAQALLTQAAKSTEQSPAEDERFNILLLGLDRRGTGQGAARSDAIELIAVDPRALSAGMVSLPRDMWVNVPGFGYSKINTAYYYGEAYQTPGGGPALAVSTVEGALGVRIHHYLVIDFHTFVQIVNELGGISVTVNQATWVPVPGYDTCPPDGTTILLSGEQAMAYAQDRNTPGGDFDRAERQQQLIMAAVDRATSLEMIPTLLTRGPELYASLASSVRTDLSLDQLLSLARLASKIPKENIKRAVIGPPDMVIPMALASGAYVLQPVPSQISLLLEEVFSPAGAASQPQTSPGLMEAARAENARIAVLNGGGVAGIANRTATLLVEHGLVIAEVGNADRLDYVKTFIIDFTGKPNTTRYLMSLMNLSEGQVLVQMQPESEIDVQIILGSDWDLPQ